MPRFVILEHDHPEPHWDLMLEADGALRTWRLSSPLRAGEVTEATATFDHRLLYLDYEGPVSGGRGEVARWDSGSFEWVSRSEDDVCARLQGNRCRGSLHLWRDGGGWKGTLAAGD